MITINAILSLNGEKIVPVRAIPFVTGGDMSPKCLAGILADPDSWFIASVIDSNNVVTQMLPKNWRQYQARLSVIAKHAGDLDLIDQDTLGLLPPSTFVYWEALWHTHETYFLPLRHEIEQLPPEEQANYELQPNAIIPKALVELVFEGFSSTPKVKPVARADAQDQEILASLVANGFSPMRLPKNDPGKPGVKAIVCKALGKSGMWGGPRVFNKAWERLLRNGDIVTYR